MEALRQAAEKGGGRPAVFHNRGFAYEQLGRLDEAEAAYGEAATRARTDAKVYLGWGVVALKRGDYGGAAGRLDRARELFGKAPPPAWFWARALRSEEHTSELQSRLHLVCRLLLEKKKKNKVQRY